MALQATQQILLWIFTIKICILTTAILLMNIKSEYDPKSSYTNGMLADQIAIYSDKCPSVLKGMMNGYWKTRLLTKKEHDDIFAFLFHAHSRYRLPPSYQRNDSLCGNVTHFSSKNYRALCDPKGSTPCCFHNKCAMKTVEECVCKECYDMRNMKHAEYSTWIPSHPGCTYQQHTPQEACDILDGMDLAFIGDSLVRHVYTAMLLVVTGNMKDGAMNKNAGNESQAVCQGMYMFTEKVCRLILLGSVNACGGKVKLRNLYYYNSGFGQVVKTISENMKNQSFIFTGIGIHDHLNHNKVQNNFLSPTLAMLKHQNRTWPKLLWVANHAPGILKSPIYLSQTADHVKRFNKQMESFLKPWNIPIFDTYNLTDGMMSFDGEHFGMGMNLVKANLLLSYIKERRAEEKW